MGHFDPKLKDKERKAERGRRREGRGTRAGVLPMIAGIGLIFLGSACQGATGEVDDKTYEREIYCAPTAYFSVGCGGPLYNPFD